MYGTDFWISSRGQLRNRTKSKIIGFSKTARWNSLKINGRSQFLMYFHLQLWKTSKSGVKICGFFSTLHVQIGKIFKKIDFFKFWFLRFLYSQLKEYRKVTMQLDFHQNPSSSFRETDNFRLYRLLSRDHGRNRKIGPDSSIDYSFSYLFEKSVCLNLQKRRRYLILEKNLSKKKLPKL